MKYGIGDLIRIVHYNMPPELRRYYKFMDVFIRKIRNYFMPVWHCVFKDMQSGGLFTYVHIGWDSKLRHYWINRFSDNFQIVFENRKSISWNINGFLEKNKDKIDLCIIESSKNAPSGRYPHSFLLPRWMEMELDFESFLKKSAIKKIGRSIKMHSLRFEVREDIESFDLFYHTMYKPTVLKRHGKSSQLAPYKGFSDKLINKKGTLFFLIKENEPVAAVFIEIKNGKYRLSLSGVKDGSGEILKMGAVGALRYFIMFYYYEKYIDTLMIGVSMPVIFDGVTEFKMHLGARPYLKDLESRSKFYFIPNNSEPLTSKMLKLNPLLYISGSELNAALFVNDEDYETKKEFFKFFNRSRIDNVEMTKVFYFDKSEKIAQWINEEEIDNIEFIKYEKWNRATDQKSPL